MRQRFFLCLAILIATSAAAQVHTISLKERIQDDQISRSLAILPVYIFESDVVEPFTMFGIDSAKAQAQPKLHIKAMPDMHNHRDTGYTYIYFSGANNAINQGYCLTLIGNYKRSRQTVYFYIDRNNNLDFTDDGKPDSIPYGVSDVTIRLQNRTNPDAHHELQLSRVEYGENIAYKRLLNEHFTKHSGNKKFSNINYCYREQRLNTIGGIYSINGDSFRIALKDLNNDGLFNEACMDKLYIGPAEEQPRTEEMTWILPNNQAMYFEWGKSRYQITSISPNGEEVQIQEVAVDKLEKELKPNKKIPNFEFVRLDNQVMSIKAFKKKPLYIFFWDEQTLSEEDTLYLNKIYYEFQNEINILTLNHGDHHRKVRKFQYYNNVVWEMGFSSYKIGKLFYLEKMPSGFLFDRKLRFVQDNTSPKVLYETLSQKTYSN